MGIITGGNGNIANVSTNNQLQVINPSNITSSGNPNNAGNYITQVCESDAGLITGAPTQRQVDISGYYRQRVGIDTLFFNDKFGGGNLITNVPSTNSWKTQTNGSTTSYSNGYTSMNASTSANNYAFIQSYRTFSVFSGYPLQFETTAMYTASSFVNNFQLLIGMMYVGTSGLPTDGVYFSQTGSIFNCNVNYNGTVLTQSATLTPPTINAYHTYLIVISNGSVEFWVDNILYANIAYLSTFGSATMTNCLPISFRIYNLATISIQPTIQLLGVNITVNDMNSNKNWQSIMSSSGNISAQYWNGYNGTFGSTANYALSTTPTASSSLSNTTAAIGSGLGGQFAGLLQLAVGTDGIVCSFQIPTLSTAYISRNLYITGVNIQSVVQVAIATNPVILAYTIAYGSTAVSLATTESATSKAPRRIALGFDSFSSTATVGTLGTNISRTFNTPIFVQCGEFIQITAKNIATALPAATSALLWNISFDGYFE